MFARIAGDPKGKSLNPFIAKKTKKKKKKKKSKQSVHVQTNYVVLWRQFLLQYNAIVMS